MDLFEHAAAELTVRQAPLASRMRPTRLDDVVGQGHLLGKGMPLRSLVDSGALPSMILWGPPGVGKTTIARAVAGETRRQFVTLSAVTSGVKEVRAEIDGARRRLGETGRGTIVFIDEIHRFNRAQQDALLPAVEDGIIVLIGATTENPYFEINTPLLSRAMLMRLEPLDEADIVALLDRAVADARGLGGSVGLDAETPELVARLAGGDARRALSMLDVAAALATTDGRGLVTKTDIVGAAGAQHVPYDRTGDSHYDILSAFIKSMRGSDVDAALYWLARMLAGGEDPKIIARRMIIFASEDVGVADNSALSTAVSAAHALQNVGLPEARLNLAHAAAVLALAPKSNAVIEAIDRAIRDAENFHPAPVPAHLRDTHYQGARALGHGDGYRYPHGYPEATVEQQYMPDGLVGARYWRGPLPIAGTWGKMSRGRSAAGGDGVSG